MVNKVSGNFHVSSHSFSYTANQLIMKGQLIDFSHKISHLSFGDESQVKQVKKLKNVNVAPLDGTKAITTSQEGNGHHAFTTYYLTVTPAQYNVN